MVSEHLPHGNNPITQQMSSSSTTSTNISSSLSLHHSSNPIPPSLKFLISSLKNIVTAQLSPETFPLWKSQITKLFSTNGFFGYLDGTLPQPPSHLLHTDGTSTHNPDHQLWTLVDQNLSAAILSTISATLLPYLLNLSSCREIWTTVHHRLQPTNRSRLIQLKHQLYNLQMKDQSMADYLSSVKSHVDAIALAGSALDTDDIIHYILNGLPPSYQSFKTSIRTNLQPLNLDDFYSLLCSEEVNLAHETRRDLLSSGSATLEPAFTATGLPQTQPHFSPRRRGRSSNRSRPLNYNNTSSRLPPPSRKTTSPSTCQIYHKFGHTADRCWHRANL